MKSNKPTQMICELGDERIQQLRSEAAAELTRLMESQNKFSFLRLGDGELRWLLRIQGGEQPVDWGSRAAGNYSVEKIFGVNGVLLKDYQRLLFAYENCSYLDYHELSGSNQVDLPKLIMRRAAGLRQNTSPQTSLIHYEWLCQEFKKYLSSHRCLIAGSEAPLLEQLHSNPSYRRIAERFWPDQANVEFERIKDDGKEYWMKLDVIKDDLKRAILKNKSDTLFLSLATGAKIICYELAEELNIRAFDFGGLLRSLTASATAGFDSIRVDYNPFYFKIPLSIYIEACRKAYPAITIETLAAKAVANLCADLHDIDMRSFKCDTRSLDMESMHPNIENLRLFKRDLDIFNSQYKKEFKQYQQARKIIDDFEGWRRKRGIGIDGKIFVSVLALKKFIKSLFSFPRE